MRLILSNVATLQMSTDDGGKVSKNCCKKGGSIVV